ncbi:type III secretion system stator protein SctL [Microbulbifer sp. JMSA003]|uniref:type III secretion system stator protein SctL n=1 Tax=unclassified Microbulbifer TaxID=2619833 RepID=UPI00403938E0
MGNFVEIVPQAVALSPESKVVKLNEYNTYLQAQDILALAEADAAEIVAGSKASIKEGYDQGYADGVQAGLSDQSEALLTTLQLCQQFLKGQQQEVVSLVKVILQKLIGEIETDTQLLKQIERAVSIHYNVDSAKLFVSPCQYRPASEKIAELLADYPTLKNFEVVSDDKVAPGSCILETPIGILNLSLEAQLSAIERSIGAHVEGG